MTKRMSPERRATYIERREIDRQETRNRRDAQAFKAFSRSAVNP